MTLLDEYFENTKKFMESHGPKTIILIQVGSFLKFMVFYIQMELIEVHY